MQWEKLLNPNRPRTSTASSPEHRVQFERDYDRAIFSTPVRRLQDKAQVFPLEPNDSVRTRLTHSLEVSSVSRGIARATSKWLSESNLISGDMDRQIEAVAATCGLIHDLGNPPFGHAGEDAIREWFKEKLKNGDFDSSYKATLMRKIRKKAQGYENDFTFFEGNAQTLRLITKLQVLSDYEGLNLTFGTLSASCKYTASSLELEKDGKHEKSKVGYFVSEKEIVDRVRSETGTGDSRNPISYLVEASDDIVYSIVDIEDGVKKGILTWEEFVNELGKESPGKYSDAIEYTMKILEPSGDPESQRDEIKINAFRTAYIGILVKDVVEAFKVNYEKIMKGEFHEELLSKAESGDLVSACKNIGRKIVYCTPETLKLELMGRTVIKDMLDIFWEGAKKFKGEPIKPKDFPGKVIALMSKNYKDVFINTNEDLDINYKQLQLVTDYVCGMTDTFICELHKQLKNA